MLPPQSNTKVLTVLFVDNLKILHGGLSDSSVEVQDVTLRFVVPDWRFVPQLHQLVHVVRLPALCGSESVSARLDISRSWVRVPVEAYVYFQLTIAY